MNLDLDYAYQPGIDPDCPNSIMSILENKFYQYYLNNIFKILYISFVFYAFLYIKFEKAVCLSRLTSLELDLVLI